MRVKMGAKNLVELGRKCPAGQIFREGYTRKGYTRKDGEHVKTAHVPGGCIRDVGLPGKVPASRRWAKFPAKGKFIAGWHHEDPVQTRHGAIKKELKREHNDCLVVQHKLLQLRNITENTSPSTSRTAEADRKWLVSQGFCHLKGKKK